MGQALATLPLLSALMSDRVNASLPLRRALRRASARRRPRSVALAYLTPVAPARWLLDTGLPLAAERGHAGTLRALHALAELSRGTSTSPALSPGIRPLAGPLHPLCRPVEI